MVNIFRGKNFLGKVRLNPLHFIGGHGISESLPDSNLLGWAGLGCLWMFGV